PVTSPRPGRTLPGQAPYHLSQGQERPWVTAVPGAGRRRRAGGWRRAGAGGRRMYGGGAGAGGDRAGHAVRVERGTLGRRPGRVRPDREGRWPPAVAAPPPGGPDIDRLPVVGAAEHAYLADQRLEQPGRHQRHG